VNNKRSDFIDSNDYKFNFGSKNGVYIIHGFTNSTFETKDLAKYLAENGYYTLAKNLPGHGTTVDDCNRCKYTDWIDFVEKDVAEMSNYCENVFVIGISMGSALAIHLCTIFPIKAAIFGAPVLKFKDYIGTNILTPLLHKIITKRSKKYSYPKKIRNSLQFYGYNEWPMSAVNEFRKLSNIVTKEMHLVKTPALIIHAELDKLQHPLNNSIVFNSISTVEKRKLVVKHAGHNLFTYSKDQKKIFEEIYHFLNNYK